jgi:hypothetical protein
VGNGKDRLKISMQDRDAKICVRRGRKKCKGLMGVIYLCGVQEGTQDFASVTKKRNKNTEEKTNAIVIK